MDILRLFFLFLEAAADLPATLNRLRQLSYREAREYLSEFRRGAIIAIFVPFILVLLGALAGGAAPVAKPYLVYTGTFLAAFFALIVAWQSIPMVAIVAALIEVARPGQARLFAPAEATAKWYVALVGGLLANELWIGLYILIAPIHRKPEVLPLLILLSLILVAYWVWRGGLGWWPKVIYASSVILLIAAALSPWFPRTASSIQQADPEQWIMQKFEEGDKDDGKKDGAPQPASPGFEILPDGTIAMDPGAIFQLPAGTTPIRFWFLASGVSFIDKRVKVVSPTVVTLANGEKTQEFVADPESHARAYGSTPCFRDVKPFFFTLSPIEGTALIRAKPVGEKCS